MSVYYFRDLYLLYPNVYFNAYIQYTSPNECYVQENQ